MTNKIRNIHNDQWQIGQDSPEGDWKYKDLSGQRLGARLEELAPGSSSSVHHYHTLEEEHVLIIEGAATLILGSQEIGLGRGDHIWFAAGDEVAHHIENRTQQACTLLVYGERNEHDLVMYPENQVMMVKALGRKQFTYRPLKKDND